MVDRVCYSMNHDGVITWISMNVFRMFGWEQSEVVGKSFIDFITEESVEEVIQNRLKRTPGKTHEYDIEIYLKNKKRERVHIRVLQTPENTVGCIDRRINKRTY